MPVQIATGRLVLLPMTDDMLDELILRERERLEDLAGARFPDPLLAPPLMEDALPFMRDRLRAHPDELGWWSWLIISTASQEAVGVAGLGGKPNDAGVVLLGYSIYPARQGQGYATEAARALLAWALGQPGVDAVRATIPPDHARSIRVAEKLGMQQVGTAQDDDVGDILVYEARRSG